MSDSTSVWGANETQHFYALTPDHILDAVERWGLRCTGRTLQLNSMENRVYEVEVELAPGQIETSPRDRFRVIKFYRPGRWSQQQINDEHIFLKALAQAELAVVAPLELPDSNETIALDPHSSIMCTLFRRAGGRPLDEPSHEELERLGRLLARMHVVGSNIEIRHRIHLSPQTFGSAHLEYLTAQKLLPAHLEDRFVQVVQEICKLSTPLFAKVPTQPIHGDLHWGNILWNDQGPLLVDFDDMAIGPIVQDLWMLAPGRDAQAREALNYLLDGYTQFSHFDHDWLKLIEPLRALRMIHFIAWIARRWSDPSFQRVFDRFGTPSYWAEQVHDLEEQLNFIREI